MTWKTTSIGLIDFLCVCWLFGGQPAGVWGQNRHPLAAPGVTSLTQPSVRFRVAKSHIATLQRGPVTAIIVDNAAVNVAELPGHRAGYSGLASLTHADDPQRRDPSANLFVSPYAGINFEHIHDGTREGLREKFEPRKFPMELRIIDEHTVELYQRPTGNWQLESCGRYAMLEDGVIEYTFECIPRAGGYHHDYIGLFWASYIQSPSDLSIYFRGRRRGSTSEATWIQATTPEHGVRSTHAPQRFPDLVAVDDDFPLTLVNHPSDFVYVEPWYYGVSHGMALVQMFRQKDRIWFAQSPSGGGQGNPAWDFQWFIENYAVGEAYGFQMRVAYLPFENRRQLERATSEHRRALNPE